VRGGGDGLALHDYVDKVGWVVGGVMMCNWGWGPGLGGQGRICERGVGWGDCIHSYAPTTNHPQQTTPRHTSPRQDEKQALSACVDAALKATQRTVMADNAAALELGAAEAAADNAAAGAGAGGSK
jgi:hypothetical protein